MGKIILIILIINFISPPTTFKEDNSCTWIRFNNRERTCEVNDDIKIDKDNIRLVGKIEQKMPKWSIVYDKYLLFASALTDSIHCYTVDELKKKWEISFKSYYQGSPICYNETLYVLTTGKKNSSLLTVISIETGKILIQKAFERINGYNPLNASGGKIFITTYKSLISLNANTLEIVWKYELSEDFYSNYCISNNKIILSTNNKILAINEKNGNLLWEQLITVNDGLEIELMVHKKVIYKLCGMKEIRSYSLDTGAPLNKYEDDDINHFSICDDRLLVSTFFDGLISLSLDMRTIYWTNKDIYYTVCNSLIPLTIDNKIFCLSGFDAKRNVDLVMLDGDDGNILWRTRPYPCFDNNPLLYTNKKLIFYSNGSANIFSLD